MSRLEFMRPILLLLAAQGIELRVIQNGMCETMSHTETYLLVIRYGATLEPRLWYFLGDVQTDAWYELAQCYIDFFISKICHLLKRM